MNVIQKKVCMLGAFSVGKTSLVSQYVDSIFSEKYTTTIGVKVDKKQILVNDKTLSMVLWDLYGEDNYQSILPSYLRGLAGYILVIDPTRLLTINAALSLHEMVTKNSTNAPFVLARNKSDLKDAWQVDELAKLADLERLSAGTIDTSAKTDSGVDELFETLASALIHAKT